MNQRRILIFFILVFGSVFFFSCVTRKGHHAAQDTVIQQPEQFEVKKPAEMNNPNHGQPTQQVPAPVIIYKTSGDFFDHVPVMLSADGNTLSSYPGIQDVSSGGTLALPTLLADGWLLDNRGINLQVAFLDYTYEEYSRLKTTPAPEEIMQHIIAKDVILEMYSCKCSRDTGIINDMIRRGNFGSCKRIK